MIFQIWTNGLTLSPTNLINVVNQYSYILILAIGMVMVIIMGHIDLSVGSVAAFTGIIVAKSMAEWDFPWPLAILLGVAVGVAIGAWHGFWVAVVGVPAFIATLAGMLIFRGGNQFIGQSTTTPVPQEFGMIGAGYLPELGGTAELQRADDAARRARRRLDRLERDPPAPQCRRRWGRIPRPSG